KSYIRAIEELERAVRLDPHRGEAWSLLAGARLQMGGFVSARDAARQAVALRPDSAVDHMLLASLLQPPNDWAGARRESGRAAALSPNDPRYRRGYGHFLLKGSAPKHMALA